MFKDEDYIKIIAWLMGVGSMLFAFVGGLIAWIFKEHIKDNHVQFSRNREDHKEIYEILRDKQDKKK